MNTQPVLTREELATVSSLYKNYREDIFRFLRSKVYDSELAEDLTQAVYLNVIRAVSSGRYKQKRDKAWLTKIAMNEFINHYRKKVKRKTDSLSAYPKEVIKNSSPNPEEILLELDIIERLRVLVDRLPAKEREIIHLRVYQEMSFKEIEVVTEDNPNTSRGYYRKAVIRLRQMMREENKKKEPREDSDAET